jgi:hypothetical protein
MRDSTSGTRAAIARDDAAADAALRAAVDALLLADVQPSADALASFADPRRTADALAYAANILRRVLMYSPPLRLLRDPHVSPTTLPGRVASAFAATTQTELRRMREPFDLNDLRAIAKGKPRAASARLALAALGEIDWRIASRVERAAWLLGALCRLARGDAP